MNDTRAQRWRLALHGWILSHEITGRLLFAMLLLVCCYRVVFMEKPLSGRDVILKGVSGEIVSVVYQCLSKLCEAEVREGFGAITGYAWEV